MRRKMTTLIFTLLMIFTTGLSLVVAAPANAVVRPAASTERHIKPDNPGVYTWSDCIYQRSLANATFIEKFRSNIVLNCGGVRHIKAGHGFDNDTEECIYNGLNNSTRSTSKANSNNWLYQAIWSAGGNEYMEFYTIYVVVSKASNTIVTAYTETNTYAGNDSWYTCARLKF